MSNFGASDGRRPRSGIAVEAYGGASATDISRNLAGQGGSKGGQFQRSKTPRTHELRGGGGRFTGSPLAVEAKAVDELG
eukprot:2731920-Prymnesium_polylepis.1